MNNQYKWTSNNLPKGFTLSEDGLLEGKIDNPVKEHKLTLDLIEDEKVIKSIDYVFTTTEA